MATRTLVWFRGKDLRISDHEPLAAALEGEELPIPVFVLDPYFFAPARAQAMPHRIQFLLESLGALQKNLAAKGSELLLVEGRSVDVIPRLVASLRANRVVAHRWTEPFGRERDRRIRERLTVPFELFEGETILPPESVRTQEGQPYSVFTPFSRAARRLITSPRPRSAPPSIPHPGPFPEISGRRSEVPTLTELGIERNPQLLGGGEALAKKRLQHFAQTQVGAYPTSRDQLSQNGTSRLSQDLKFGTLSPRAVWRRSMDEPPSEGWRVFQNELLWREFAYANLWDRPNLLQEPFREAFAHFPYTNTHHLWAAWQEGRTGYPVVDAAMRQLLAEGYVHNRARMIAASFLTKHLLVDYRQGEAHYLRYLTDGDWAVNNLNWQWAAGCGVDAAPYFRIFHPVIQGKKFDADGAYVKRYVPELGQLPARWVHAPWTAPPATLAAAGIALGRTYPAPVVDHAEARAEYLRRANVTLGKIPKPGGA